MIPKSLRWIFIVIIFANAIYDFKNHDIIMGYIMIGIGVTLGIAYYFDCKK